MNVLTENDVWFYTYNRCDSLIAAFVLQITTFMNVLIRVLCFSLLCKKDDSVVAVLVIEITSLMNVLNRVSFLSSMCEKDDSMVAAAVISIASLIYALYGAGSDIVCVAVP